MQEYDVNLRYTGSVCISGLTASGKTTHSHLLSGEFGLTYVSGSQIQLNFLGVSPIQSRDFWIAAEAKGLWNEQSFDRIDNELLRLESIAQGYIFDTSTMPWRHKRPALCIWLESSLESRIVKAIVSHRGQGRFSHAEYRHKIMEKDAATAALYKRLYDINIGTDLSCFDLVLDISNLITKPSFDASLASIHAAHSLIRPAVGWYLTRKSNFEVEFKETADTFGHLIKLNNLFK
ncbi:MAG: cytidylate kinase family protein [Acidiferrobacteraceae bacterium]